MPLFDCAQGKVVFIGYLACAQKTVASGGKLYVGVGGVRA